MSSSYCPVWWEAVMIVDVVLSNSLVSFDFDRDGNALNQVQRVIGSQ